MAYKQQLDRPKIKIEYSFYDYFFELTSIAAVIIGIVLILANWSSLPQRIPTHFGFDGQPDGWGGKANLLLYLGINLPMYLLLTIAGRYPHTFNYMVKITAENAKCQYRIAKRMMLSLKLEIMILFSYLEYNQIQIAKEHGKGLGTAFIFVVLIVVFGSLTYFIMKQYQYKNGEKS